MPTHLPRLTFLLALLLALLACASPAASLPAPGAPAPLFTLPRLTGSPLSLAQQRGDVVVVNFWATWCVPCREEMPRLQQLGSAFQGQPVALDEVDVQESASDIAPFVQQLNLSAPVLLDEQGDTARAYTVHGLPSTFLVDPTGTIRQVRLGPLATDDNASWSAAWLGQQIRALLPG